jgi:hypothetical protein
MYDFFKLKDASIGNIHCFHCKLVQLEPAAFR